MADNTSLCADVWSSLYSLGRLMHGWAEELTGIGFRVARLPSAVNLRRCSIDLAPLRF